MGTVEAIVIAAFGLTIQYAIGSRINAIREKEEEMDRNWWNRNEQLTLVHNMAVAGGDSINVASQKMMNAEMEMAAEYNKWKLGARSRLKRKVAFGIVLLVYTILFLDLIIREMIA